MSAGNLVASRKSQVASCKLQAATVPIHRDVSCQLSDVSDVSAAFGRRKEGKGKPLMPTAHARACLLACPSRSEIHHPCSAFRPIPVGISRSLEAQFNSPLNSLRFTHSHSLVVRTYYICTSATIISGCRKDASTALMENSFRLQKDQEKNRFSNGRIRETHSALTDACIVHSQPAMYPLHPSLCYISLVGHITLSRSRSTPVVLTSNRQHECFAELRTWCSSNE